MSATQKTLIITTLALIGVCLTYLALTGKGGQDKPLDEAQIKSVLQEMSGNNWVASSTPEEREKFVDAQKKILDDMLADKGTSSTSTVEQAKFQQEQIDILEALKSK